MNDRTVKTAIIGVGRWGKNVAREMGATSELVAYTSNGSAETDAWAQEHIPSARRMSLADVCADPNIEAVAIATPIATHAEIARSLIEAGKHLLVEKPLAASAVDAQALVAASRANRTLLATGYVFLYSPAYQELRRELAGKTVARATWHWKKYGSFIEDIELNLQTHHLALALDLFGEPIHGTARRGPGVESNCDRLDTHLSYDGYDVDSYIDRASEEKIHTLEVQLEDGSSYIWNGTTLSLKQDDHTKTIFTDERQPLALEVAAFVAAARGDVGSLCGQDDFGARVLALHERLIRS